MKVHHLNCGTMQPPLLSGGLVCHVLLLEAPGGLVLVDTGLGLRDGPERVTRIGPLRHLIRPSFDVEETAIRQVTRLGFDPKDVRHIVLTHFDVDHVGGLADFPWAQVHLTAAEAFAACHPRDFGERTRYRAAQRDHDPTLVEHTPSEAEAWRGFAAATDLSAVAPGLVLVNLAGHTRGHAAVAVETEDRCILHAGDAFYDCAQIDGSPGGGSRLLRFFERRAAHDWPRVQQNHARLRELWAEGDPKLRLINAHDPELLRRAQA